MTITPTARYFLALVLIAAFGAGVTAGRRAAAAQAALRATKAIAFIGVNVVPMTRDGLTPAQTVIVESGRITTIGPEATTAVPEGALLESLSSRPVRPNRLALKVDGRTVFVALFEIDFIEAAGNYVQIHAGAETYMVRDRLSAIEGRLDSATFARVHRSTIVNVTRVKEMHPLFNGDQSLVLENGRRLTMSRTYREAVIALMAGPASTPD